MNLSKSQPNMLGMLNTHEMRAMIFTPVSAKN